MIPTSTVARSLVLYSCCATPRPIQFTSLIAWAPMASLLNGFAAVGSIAFFLFCFIVDWLMFSVILGIFVFRMDLIKSKGSQSWMLVSPFCLPLETELKSFDLNLRIALEPIGSQPTQPPTAGGNDRRVLLLVRHRLARCGCANHRVRGWHYRRGVGTYK